MMIKTEIKISITEIIFIVGRPTRQCLPDLGFLGTAIDSQSTKIVLEECDVSFPLVNREKSNL